MMKTLNYSRQNLDFILYEVHDVLSLSRGSYFVGHDNESYKLVIDTAENIAEKTMRPYYRVSDRQAPVYVNGTVKVHEAIKLYYKAFCESGLVGACLEHRFGGQQLPKSVFAAADFILGNAHNGFEMFTSLARGAVSVITSFGSPELTNEFVPKIGSGECTATMCLTEPHAGSSLSDITTEAIHQGEGIYTIKGQKIFISAGDHDITENIIHLVLARVKGSPKGAKALSLFIVPKKRMTNQGSWESNDVSSLGMFHKMGQRSTPAMHLAFGVNDNCIGYLIGDEGNGLTYMFQMMNSARLGVGLAGTYIASAAYYASLQYARERPQGRRLNNKDLTAPQVTIIHHPDVRRMLFAQKSFVEGSLAFVLQCHYYGDMEMISSDDERQRYQDLQDLLTPVAKTVGAEMGIVSVNNGLQVLGGYGYTEDFILEQLARDVRIMSLYEGTTGIQSQMLLGRQISMNNGRALKYWNAEVERDIDSAMGFDETKRYGLQLREELLEFNEITRHLLRVGSHGNAEVFLSDATLYMELFALLNMAWQWLKQGTVAQKSMMQKYDSGDGFYQSKVATMEFFFHYELPKTKGLCVRIKDQKVITVWKEQEVLM